jgi:hypothetical protein
MVNRIYRMLNDFDIQDREWVLQQAWKRQDYQTARTAANSLYETYYAEWMRCLAELRALNMKVLPSEGAADPELLYEITDCRRNLERVWSDMKRVSLIGGESVWKEVQRKTNG